MPLEGPMPTVVPEALEGPMPTVVPEALEGPFNIFHPP